MDGEEVALNFVEQFVPAEAGEAADRGVELILRKGHEPLQDVPAAQDQTEDGDDDAEKGRELLLGEQVDEPVPEVSEEIHKDPVAMGG